MPQLKLAREYRARWVNRVQEESGVNVGEGKETMSDRGIVMSAALTLTRGLAVADIFAQFLR